MELKKIVWAAILAALSIVIDIAFKMIIPLQTMGTAYYAIPIIIGAIFLGPKYSIWIAFISDFISVFIAGHTFFPLFSLASTLWGVIPGFLLKGKTNLKRILIVVFLTHLIVTTVNSFALYIHFHKTIEALLVDLPLRYGLIIPNSLIIAILVHASLIPISDKNVFKISG